MTDLGQDKNATRRRSGNEELVNVKRSDILDKIIVEYLGGNPESKSEYTGFVRAIVPFISPKKEGTDEPVFPLADEISAIDPFYNTDEDKERIMNSGRMGEKGADTKVVLYVEVPLIYEKLIKIVGVDPAAPGEDGKVKVPTKKEIDEAKNTGVYSLATLLRVELTEKKERLPKLREAIIVSFKDKRNLRHPYFVKYPKNVPVYVEEDVRDKSKVAEAFVS